MRVAFPSFLLKTPSGIPHMAEADGSVCPSHPIIFLVLGASAVHLFLCVLWKCCPGCQGDTCMCCFQHFFIPSHFLGGWGEGSSLPLQNRNK